MNFSSSRRKISFASAATIVCLGVGLGAGLPAIANASPTMASASVQTSTTAAPTSTADLWAEAQSAPAQSPVDPVQVGSGVTTFDLSQVGVGLPPGSGNAGTISRAADYAPAGSAVAVIPAASGAAGLGGATFPIWIGTASASIFEVIYVLPGTPTGTRTINLLTDPVFKKMADALDLAGPVYVAGADRVTGIWSNVQGAFTTQVFGSMDGTVTVTFDGTPAAITSGTSTVLDVTAPAHSAGLVDVVVTCNGLTAAPVGYTYEDPIVPPTPGPTPPVVPAPKPAPVSPPVAAPKLPVVSG